MHSTTCPTSITATAALKPPQAALVDSAEVGTEEAGMLG
jgi:hypothetical protein